MADAVSIITQVANEYGIPPELAIAIARQESGLNPTAVGDNGTSFGLFQLHEGGELGDLTPEQAYDPYTNARVALRVVADQYHAHPDWSWGQIAAAAQRPADQAGYANKINALVGGTMTPSSVGTSPQTVATSVQPPDLNTLASQFGFMAAQFQSDPSLAEWAQQYMSGAFGDVTTDIGKQKAKAALVATQWYQTHDSNQRAWQQLQASDPATAQEQLTQGIKHIADLEYQLGVSVPMATLVDLANQAIPNKWSDSDITKALAAHIDPNNLGFRGSGGAGQGLGATVDQLQNIANQYGLPVASSTLGQWAQGILAGTSSAEQFTEYAKTQAKSLFPGLSDQIDKGVTVAQFADPYVTRMNQILELPGDETNSTAWMSDPLVKQALQYRPQDSKPTDPPGAMPLYQFEQLVKEDPRWLNTDNAKQGALSTVQELGRAFGVSI